VAIVSRYALPLLEGCGTVEQGELRIVGVTDQVPFIGVFATGRVNREREGQLWQALSEMFGVKFSVLGGFSIQPLLTSVHVYL